MGYWNRSRDTPYPSIMSPWVAEATAAVDIRHTVLKTVYFAKRGL
jgi:hypothetical protein